MADQKKIDRLIALSKEIEESQKDMDKKIVESCKDKDRNKLKTSIKNYDKSLIRMRKSVKKYCGENILSAAMDREIGQDDFYYGLDDANYRSGKKSIKIRDRFDILDL
jgi:hypothetical protein